MTARIDHVDAKLDVYDEFEGRRIVDLSFDLGPGDMTLTNLLMDKWREQDAARLAAAGKTNPFDFT